jgi:hypothetical protein
MVCSCMRLLLLGAHAGGTAPTTAGNDDSSHIADNKHAADTTKQDEA